MMICGGGTGGHVYPGVAVAREFNARGPGYTSVFVGTEQGMESSILPKEGLPLETIRAGGWIGKSWAARGAAVLRLPLGMARSARILRRHRPRFVLGVGGYVSFPFTLTAILLGYPVFLHEQNAVPGLANRILSRWAKEVFITYPESREYFPRANTVVTGNPVRSSFAEQARKAPAPSATPRVLIFGGSRGAASINRAVREALPHLSEKGKTLYLVLQTGPQDYDQTKRALDRSGIAGEVHAFIGNMPEVMGSADLVVARAGASTLAEVTLAGKPSILIPYPFAAHDHQTRNAETLKGAGAAEVIRDADLNGPGLAQTILSLAGDAPRRQRMAEAALRLGNPDAAKRIVDRILEARG